MRRVLSAFAFGVLPALACSNGSVTYATPPTLPEAGAIDGGAAVDAALPPGLGVGGACDMARPCRAGLDCAAGKCAPGHSLGDGAPCVISDECKVGQYCGAARTCAPAGSGADGDGCKSNADCAAGLACQLVGLTTQCKPEGGGDVGSACTNAKDCLGGLACVGKACAPLPPSPGGVPPLGVPPWPGVTCADDPPPAKAYFRVPRGSADGDFFRLPFPNDARMKGGRPDLSGFPTPGPELLGFDIVDRYARDVEARTGGWGAYPTVTLRFSAPPDFPALKQPGVIRWVDVTPGGSGDDIGFAWSATTGRSAYVCENALSARPPQGQPLTPGSTYALLVTTAAQAAGGPAYARGDDFAAMVGAAAPTDGALTPAWTAYKPLRDWAAKKSVSLDTILTAAVFTVGRPTEPAQALATAIGGLAAPTAATWVKCGGTTPSPCPQATGDRACGAADPAFDELHAIVSLPVFQTGTAPYEDTGGDLTLDTKGVPQVQRTEPVCLALTVPKGAAMPAGGWPLVVYAHGTGGSFRSHITEGTAARLASVDDGAGGQVRIAVLGIDQVQHGPRRGASTASPNNLFFNFTNPSAARGNPLQGAADQMSLVRFAKALDLPAGQVTPSAIKFGRVAYWGHSQGATEGAIALPYTAGVTGAVLSGEGASLIDALLSKRSPVDIADAIPFALEDPSVSSSHPVLALLQQAIDVADPLHHARALAAAPVAPNVAMHVFQPYGLGDTYAPPVTEATYAIAAGLGLLAAAPGVGTPDGIGSLSPVAAPASGNLGAGKISAFVREYAPSGYDGHFVAFKDAAGQKDVAHFLADALQGAVPKVGR